ncbi:MAG: hypothetical protein U0414_03170 [Polyangiaceae bacterium]
MKYGLWDNAAERGPSGVETHFAHGFGVGYLVGGAAITALETALAFEDGGVVPIALNVSPTSVSVSVPF